MNAGLYAAAGIAELIWVLGCRGTARDHHCLGRSDERLVDVHGPIELHGVTAVEGARDASGQDGNTAEGEPEFVADLQRSIYGFDIFAVIYGRAR